MAVLLLASTVFVVVAVLALTGRGSAEAASVPLGGILPQLALVLAVGSLYGTLAASGEELRRRGYALPRQGAWG